MTSSLATGHSRRIRKITIHKGYEGTDESSHHHDIALIEVGYFIFSFFFRIFKRWFLYEIFTQLSVKWFTYFIFKISTNQMTDYNS